MHKLVLPEVVAGVLDELDEGNEEPPRVRPVDDQPLKQHARDLLLNGLRVGLREEREEGTAEEVRVAVGVAKLVGYGVEEEVPPWRGGGGRGEGRGGGGGERGGGGGRVGRGEGRGERGVDSKRLWSWRAKRCVLYMCC